MPLDPAKILQRREALGLSQGDAARLAGMARPNWARIESGRRIDPALSTAQSIARALKVPLAQLLLK